MEHGAAAAWVPVVVAGWRRGRELGAVGPGSVERHLDHARGLAQLIPDDADVGLDLGSGAGIPGLALAGLRPAMRWVLLDASQRRTKVLADVVRHAGWADRVEVVHQRAEVAARDERFRGRFAVVTARSFGPPPVTAECAAPFVRLGGRVLVADRPDVDVSERWPDHGLEPLGLARGRRLSEPTVQVLDAVDVPEPRFPRQPGVARRRPLW